MDAQKKDEPKKGVNPRFPSGYMLTDQRVEFELGTSRTLSENHTN